MRQNTALDTKATSASKKQQQHRAPSSFVFFFVFFALSNELNLISNFYYGLVTFEVTQSLNGRCLCILPLLYANFFFAFIIFECLCYVGAHTKIRIRNWYLCIVGCCRFAIAISVSLPLLSLAFVSENSWRNFSFLSLLVHATWCMEPFTEWMNDKKWKIIWSKLQQHEMYLMKSHNVFCRF